MALWGNRDNIDSPGTVTLNYATNVVTGSGTSFGLDDNQAQPGNVISFGVPFTGPATNMGDAVIVSIASSEEMTVLNTDGLNGVEISGVEYQISEAPKYLPADAAINQVVDSIQQVNVIYTGIVTATVAIGATIIPVSAGLVAAGVATGNRAQAITITELHEGDIVTVDAVNSDQELQITEGIPQTTLNYKSATGLTTNAVGVNTITILGNSADPDPDLNASDEIRVGDLLSLFPAGISDAAVTAVRYEDEGKALVSFSSTVTTVSEVGAAVTVTRGIANGNSIKIAASVITVADGISDKNILGVNNTTMNAALGSSYQVISAGWVGVTTYLDNGGNLRVKNETYVAMSGIETGNTNYPPA